MPTFSDPGLAPSPWRAGLRAARLNLIPGIILQGAALALLVSYYSLPALREALAGLEASKAEYGFLFAAAGGALFCGLVPWLFQMAIPRLRPDRPLPALMFGIVWWALILMLNDSFYRLQAAMWGQDTRPLTVLAKVATDMLIYTPFIASPLNALSHHWKAADYPWTRLGLPLGWYRHIVLPNLIPNWAIWLPGTLIVYSLPTMLQLPMSNLLGCFWALLCISIASSNRT